MVELTAPAEPHRIPVSGAVPKSDFGSRFHISMLVGCSLLLLIILACSLKAPVVDWRSKIEVGLVAVIVSAIPGMLWHDRTQIIRRDAALTLPWAFVLMILLPIAAVLSAQLRFPLRDDLFVKLDLAFGFNDPAFVEWCAAHSLVGDILDRSYSFLTPLLACAIFLPALLGKAEAAQKFVLANLIAFVGSFPLFAFLPAVGPWYGFHFPGNQPQLMDEAATVALHSGARAAAMAGILCFPSFHVIWASLSALALARVKLLRLPAAVIAFLVIVSTVTTGWHYAADLVAGLAIAGLSWTLAGAFVRTRNRSSSRHF